MMGRSRGTNPKGRPKGRGKGNTNIHRSGKCRPPDSQSHLQSQSRRTGLRGLDIYPFRVSIHPSLSATHQQERHSIADPPVEDEDEDEESRAESTQLPIFDPLDPHPTLAINQSTRSRTGESLLAGAASQCDQDQDQGPASPTTWGWDVTVCCPFLATLPVACCSPPGHGASLAGGSR